MKPTPEMFRHAQLLQQQEKMRQVQMMQYQQQQMMQQQAQQQQMMAMQQMQQQKPLTPDEERRKAVQQAGIESSRKREMEMRQAKQFYREPDAIERYEQQRQQQQQMQQGGGANPMAAMMGGMSEEKTPNFSPNPRDTPTQGGFNSIAGMDTQGPTDTGAAAAQSKAFSANPTRSTGKVSVYGGPGVGYIDVDDNDERLSITRSTARAAAQDLETKKSFFSNQQPNSDTAKLNKGQIVQQDTIAKGSPVTAIQARLQKDNKIASQFGKIADNERILQDMSGIPNSYQTRKEAVLDAFNILGHPLMNLRNLNEEKAVKARIGFTGKPRNNNTDMRKAKEMQMFVDAKDVDRAKGKMFDITFASERQMNKFMGAYDVMLVDMLEDVQIDEAMAPFNPMGGGKRKPATNIGKDLRNELQMTKPSEYSFSAPAADGGTFAVIPIKTSRPSSQAGVLMAIFDKRGKVSAYYGTHMDTDSAKKFAKRDGLIESVNEERFKEPKKVNYKGGTALPSTMAKGRKPVVISTSRGYIVQAYNKKRDIFSQEGPAYKTRAEAEKAAKLLEDVQLDEGTMNFMFDSPLKAGAFAQRVMRDKLASEVDRYVDHGKRKEVVELITHPNNYEKDDILKLAKRYKGTFHGMSEEFRFPQSGENYGELTKSISGTGPSMSDLKKKSAEIRRKFAAVMRKHKGTKVGEVLDLLDKKGERQVYQDSDIKQISKYLTKHKDNVRKVANQMLTDLMMGDNYLANKRIPVKEDVRLDESSLRRKVTIAQGKLRRAGIPSSFQFGELYVHDKHLKKAMAVIGGDRDLLLVGQPVPLTKDEIDELRSNDICN